MRVALCTEVLYPLYGVEKRCVELASRLPKYGFDVDLYTSTPKKYFPGLNINQVSHPTIKRPPRRNYAFCIDYWFNLFKKLLKGNYDIIDANGHLSLIPCSLASMLKRKPVIATIHDLYLLEWMGIYGGIGSFFGLPFEVLSSKMPYNKIITLNASLEKKMTELLKIDKEKVEIIPSGIDIKYIDSIKHGEKKNRILYVGRLVPQKNVDLLLRALSLLDNVELRIIGDGSELLRLKELARKLNIDKRIHFLGKLKGHDAVIREMKESSIFVLPSIKECFGITVLEAMRCGTAVISTGTEGPRDLIRNGKNGFLTEIGNAEELAKNMGILLGDKKLRRRFQHNGRKFAKKYDWNEIVKKIANVYRNFE